MKIRGVIFFLLAFLSGTAYAQDNVTMEYSSEDVYINNPAKVDLVANINGSHHLLSFNYKEAPELFIFDKKLEVQHKIILPFTLPERSDIKIIRFPAVYYLCIHPRFTAKHLVWKIDAAGNATDLSLPFEQLLHSQPAEAEMGFQLIPHEQGFFMLYHTDLDNTEKNTVILVQTDSAFNTAFRHKVTYDFKKDEELLLQELVMFGRYLLVLKTSRSRTAMALMKVNLATSFAIKNTFYSSGYSYLQPTIDYNNSDSSITVTALLSDLGTYASRNYVFVSRLNKILVEQVPFAILKSQFIKKTSTNFVLVNHSSRWVRLRASGYQQNVNYGLGNISLYQDLITPDSNRILSTVKPVSTTTERYAYWDNAEPGIRFSLLDKNFSIVNEKRVANTKDSYTINAGQFTRFKANNREYMLVGQRFSRRFNGLLMVSANDSMQLQYTDVRVYVKNDYLLSKAQVVSANSILIPYLRRREAGLVKITIE